MSGDRWYQVASAQTSKLFVLVSEPLHTWASKCLVFHPGSWHHPCSMRPLSPCRRKLSSARQTWCTIAWQGHTSPKRPRAFALSSSSLRIISQANLNQDGRLQRAVFCWRIASTSACTILTGVACEICHLDSMQASPGLWCRLPPSVEALLHNHHHMFAVVRARSCHPVPRSTFSTRLQSRD